MYASVQLAVTLLSIFTQREKNSKVLHYREKGLKLVQLGYK